MTAGVCDTDADESVAWKTVRLAFSTERADSERGSCMLWLLMM